MAKALRHRRVRRGGSHINTAHCTAQGIGQLRLEVNPSPRRATSYPLGHPLSPTRTNHWRAKVVVSKRLTLVWVGDQIMVDKPNGRRYPISSHPDLIWMVMRDCLGYCGKQHLFDAIAILQGAAAMMNLVS
jgi:hypothetical protein